MTIVYGQDLYQIKYTQVSLNKTYSRLLAEISEFC